MKSNVRVTNSAPEQVSARSSPSTRATMDSIPGNHKYLDIDRDLEVCGTIACAGAPELLDSPMKTLVSAQD